MYFFSLGGTESCKTTNLSRTKTLPGHFLPPQHLPLPREPPCCFQQAIQVSCDKVTCTKTREKKQSARITLSSARAAKENASTKERAKRTDTRTANKARELQMEHAEWRIEHASYKQSMRTANRARGMSSRAFECSDDPYGPPYKVNFAFNGTLSVKQLAISSPNLEQFDFPQHSSTFSSVFFFKDSINCLRAPLHNKQFCHRT